MRRLLGMGILACSLAPAAAMAWDPGPYLGFGFGRTSFDLSVSDFNDGNLVDGTVDTTDTGYKLYGGYRITPNVGVEAHYTNLGKTTFRGTAEGLQEEHWCLGRVASRVKTDGFGVSLVGNAPLTRVVNAYGKFGIFAWDWNARESDSCGTFRDSETGTDLSFGLGVSYQINYLTAVHLEWERFKDVFSGFASEFDVDFYSLGLSFSLY